MCSDCGVNISEQAHFTSLCEWVCNAGFYKNTNSTCTLCTSSDVCDPGFYKPPCTNGISDQECVNCNNKPSDIKSFYTSPSTDNTATGCLWACNMGYFKNTSIDKCDVCSIACPIGQYPSGNCFDNDKSEKAPECKNCTHIPDGKFISNGTSNNASSCAFTCNYGFFLSSAQCKRWTNRPCEKGEYLEPGNSTFDTSCEPCPDKKDKDIYDYNINSCTYQCGAGYEYTTDNICIQCSPGKYQAISSKSPCNVCPQDMYEENLGSIECTKVPDNGTAIKNQQDFACNSGFIKTPPVDSLNTKPSCSRCPNNNDYRLNKAKDIVWIPGSCNLTSLSCNAGYYRNWTYEGCIPCPIIVPNNSLSATVLSLPCPTCKNASEYDRHYFCPFRCNMGYYASPNFNYSCSRCATTSCTAGLYLHFCTGGGTSDLCLKCGHQLKEFQEWTLAVECQWHCSEGYFLQTSDQTCSLCPPGKYKTSKGNQSCVDCARGSYSSSSTTCQVCDRGSYSNASASTTCTSCKSGSYASEQNSTTCRNCTDVKTYPSSISPITGAWGCGLCPVLVPYSQDGIVCSLPMPPCPMGFFLPYQKTRCELCPTGTYCNISGSVYPWTCPFSTPFSVLPAISASNCTSINPFEGDGWRETCQ